MSTIGQNIQSSPLLKISRPGLQRFLEHHLIIPVVTFIVLFFITLAGFVALNGQEMGPSDTKIVHLSVDGQVQVVPTRVATVAQLLERVGITLDEKDIVEPSADTEISESDFMINVYNARPILVIDGDKQVATVTAEPQPAKAAAAAGIEVFPEDKVEKEAQIMEPGTVLEEGIIAERIVIDRATLAHLNLYGTAIPLRSHAETVGEMLKEKNIKPLDKDEIHPAPDTPMVAGIQIFITREGVRIDSRTEPVAAPIETIQDPNLTAGKRVVRQVGAPGEKIVTYEVEVKNGKEVSRKTIQEVIIKAPVKQVVVVGAKKSYISASNAELLRMLRMCETGGNYTTNTGNGYYGAYQFSASTWRSMGTGYPSAHVAPPDVQDDAALRLAKRSGFHSQFPGCSRKLSLPPYPN